MERLRTQPWDAADYLETEEDIVAYLEAVLEEGDRQLFDAALIDIAKARGFTTIATVALRGTGPLGGTVEDLWSSHFATPTKTCQVKTIEHETRGRSTRA